MRSAGDTAKRITPPLRGGALSAKLGPLSSYFCADSLKFDHSPTSDAARIRRNDWRGLTACCAAG